jgi:penicillin-binding protein A
MNRNDEFYGGWRDYQKRLRESEKKRAFYRKAPVLFALSGCTLLILIFLFSVTTWVSGNIGRHISLPSVPSKSVDIPPVNITRQGLPLLLGDLRLTDPGISDRFVLEKDGMEFSGLTSIDMPLQDYISSLLKRSLTVEAAVVVLNPANGQILSMASHSGREGDPGENLCLNASFPAASLFKIVSAAAALEKAGFHPDQALYFLGGSHTLYKSQLKETKKRSGTETSLRKAFAKSINAVFGKMGAHDLGVEILAEYSNRFLFNQMIPFDLPLAMSTMSVPEDPFGLAEVASGFNKETLISPLHAALLASAIANDGTMMAPWLVKEISDSTGRVLYEGEPAELVSPIGVDTAKDLRILMRDTVLYGTCRRTLGSLLKKRNFKDVELGAKTGTINDRMGQFRIDWLTAYALPAHRKEEGISIAVLAVHGEKLGIRSNELARIIIDHQVSSAALRKAKEMEQ